MNICWFIKKINWYFVFNKYFQNLSLKQTNFLDSMELKILVCFLGRYLEIKIENISDLDDCGDKCCDVLPAEKKSINIYKVFLQITENNM